MVATLLTFANRCGRGTGHLQAEMRIAP